METTVCLNTSIFYPAGDWSNLISKVIKPFINTLDKELPYLIMLNKERGENIRLVIQTDRDSFTALADHQHQHLTTFMKAQAFEANESNVPLSSFFMDFPQGTLQYNLFQYKPMKHSFAAVDKALASYFYRFSNLLVNMDTKSLAEGLDNLFLFSFQLHWYWGQCYSSNLAIRNEFFNELFERAFSECPGDHEHLRQVLHESFEEHENSLIEYISDFSGFSSNTKWVSEFKGMSEDLLSTLKHSLKEESDIQSVANDVLKNINYHLAIENEVTMRYFLKRVIANTTVRSLNI